MALLSVLTLVGVHAALVAYFDRMARAEELRKVGDAVPAPLLNLRADEHTRLTSGPVSIEAAMQEIAARGRAAASPDIMPSASKDLTPLQGWTQMPLAVPAAMTAVRPEPPPAPAQLAADAGSQAPLKGTKAVHPAHDGGAPSKPPPKSP